MRFDQFVDLDRELQFPGAAGEEMRRVRAEAEGKGKTDEELMLAWLGEERRDGLSLGEMARGVFGWIFAAAGVLGAVSGAGAAAGLLRYDGSEPINVLLFLAALVGVQLALIPFLAVAFLFRRRLGAGARIAKGIAGSAMRRLIRTEAARRATGRSAAELEAEWGRLQGSGTLYSRVQPVLLLLVSQIFGVAFNLAAIATLVFLVLVSDLSFAWSTTLQVEPERIHRIVSWLAAPWAAIWPAAHPSLELVEATRFVRLNGSFVGTREMAGLLAGGWWPFLVAATFAYGLLPRAIALATGIGLLRREMRRALERNGKVRDLAERLRTPWVVVEADREEERSDSRPVVEVALSEKTVAGKPAAGKTGAEKPAAVESGFRLGVVFWAYDRIPGREEIARLLRERLGAEASFWEEAGRLEKPEAASLEKLRAGRKAGELDGAAVFFEPFEPPKTDARRFLRSVREAIGAEAPLLAVLGEFGEDGVVPPESADLETWQKAVAAEGDPFLFLKAIGPE